MTNRIKPAPVVVLISGTGSTMAALLEACTDDGYGARIAGVISDQPDAPGLEIARRHDVPTAVVDVKDFDSRALWNEALAAAIAAFSPALVMMAGFMKIVAEPCLSQFAGIMVNTHPSLLPAFPGAHAVADALAAGVKVTGCSVIVVDAGVDTGPIVAQAAVSVEDGDTVDTLHSRIKVRERELVVDTVGRMVREGWSVDGRHVSWGGRDE